MREAAVEMKQDDEWTEEEGHRRERVDKSKLVLILWIFLLFQANFEWRGQSLKSTTVWLAYYEIEMQQCEPLVACTTMPTRNEIVL